MSPSTDPQPDSTEEWDGLDVALTLKASVPAIAGRLAQASAQISDEALRAAVLAVLAAAPWPSADVRVRPDRAPGQGGAWRFDLLIESSDRVLAAVDVRSGADDLERQVLALSRLSLALSRGVAERGLLVAVSRLRPGDAGEALVGSIVASAEPASPSLLITVPVPRPDSSWELSVVEARRATEPRFHG